MTVMVETNSTLFNGAGNTGPFTWTWRFIRNSDVTVTKTVAGVETELVEGIGYTLAGAMSYQGGTLITLAPLLNGETLFAYRNTTVVQQTDLRNQGDFYAENYEDAIDEIVMMIQDVRSSLQRTYDAFVVYMQGLFDAFNAAATQAYNAFVAGIENRFVTAEDRISSGEARLTAIEARGYSVFLNQAFQGSSVIVEVDTQFGDVDAVLPVDGEAVIIKKGADAYVVTVISGVVGQTVNDDIPVILEVDGQFVRLVLLGTNWKIIG